MRTYVLITVVSWFLFSCSNDDYCGAPDVSDIPVNVKVERLDEALFSLQTKEEIRDFLDEHPTYTSQFLKAGNYPDDSILVGEIDRLIHDPHIDTVYQETQQVFGDLSKLKKEFKRAFQYLKYYYPDFSPPTIYTVFSGLGTIGPDLMVSDSAIMISLEFFLGENATYRPQVYDYILKRYQPEYILPTCIMLYSGKYNITNEKDETLLADMIYYGKSYYFTQKILPCTPDSIIAGYTDGQESILENNTRVVWAHFIDGSLLYETSKFVKSHYVDERPSVIEINNQIPGRVGRWLGWQIVEEYAEKTDISLPALMRQQDVQEIFRQSRYKP